MHTIYLKKNKEESLLRFHPWVFSGAIQNTNSQPKEGELVCVKAYDGTPLAVGHWQQGSIAVRILQFNTDTLQTDFFYQRIKAAYQLRQATLNLHPTLNNTFRLVHGEGDFLPGLIIDIYNDTAVLQAHSAGMHLQRQEIAQAILQVIPQVRNVYYKSESTLPFTRNFSDIQDGYLIGGESSCLATENSLTFQIDWLRGQKTGFFVDQRENRALLQQYAHNRRVLNMFCYTGGFSVYAIKAGATLVHSVDSSSKAIQLVEQNVQLNFPDCKQHQAFTADAFQFLDQHQQLISQNQQQPYDLIVLDPPAFAKHRSAIHNALQGYKRLNAKAMQQIAPGGILFTFSCSQAIDKQMFRLAVFSAATIAGRKVRILHQLTQPQDHPINIYHPEGEYLKGLVLYVE